MSDRSAKSPAASLVGEPVLVTGGGGFIGSKLVTKLARAGVVVHASGRRPRSGDAAVWEVCDVADHGAVKEVVRRVRPRVVWHLAATAVGQSDPEIVVPMFRTNALGTPNVLDACREVGNVRVVVAGSMEEPRGDEPPRTPYQASKAAASVLADLYRETYSLDARRLRIHMVYGPGEREHTMLIPHVIESLLAGSVPRLRDGRRRVDWVYVDDVVDALLAAAAVDVEAPGPVDVGTGVLTSVADVVTEVVGHFDGATFEVGAEADAADDRARAADVAATFERLGWRASTSLSEGIAQTVSWWRARADATSA